MKGAIQDPALYRLMCEPHADADAAEAAMVEFLKDVRAAREKHRIKDVHVVAEVTYLADGKEVTGASSIHNGNAGNALPMLASAYGAERARWEDMLGQAVRGRTK